MTVGCLRSEQDCSSEGSISCSVFVMQFVYIQPCCLTTSFDRKKSHLTFLQGGKNSRKCFSGWIWRMLKFAVVRSCRVDYARMDWMIFGVLFRVFVVKKTDVLLGLHRSWRCIWQAIAMQRYLRLPVDTASQYRRLIYAFKTRNINRHLFRPLT